MNWQKGLPLQIGAQQPLRGPHRVKREAITASPKLPMEAAPCSAVSEDHDMLWGVAQLVQGWLAGRVNHPWGPAQEAKCVVARREAMLLD